MCVYKVTKLKLDATDLTITKRHQAKLNNATPNNKGSNTNLVYTY